MPILGVIASSISGNLYSASFDSIATLSGGGTSVTFSSIPQTYTHLQIRALVRMASGTSGSDNMGMEFNGNTTYTNYASHVLQGDGGNAASQSFTGTAPIVLRDAVPRSGITANIYGTLIIDILDYTNTNKNKTTRVLLGKDYNGNTPVGSVALVSGLWTNTNAINSIKLYDLDNPSYNFTSASTFALYGIKVA